MAFSWLASAYQLSNNHWQSLLRINDIVRGKEFSENVSMKETLTGVKLDIQSSLYVRAVGPQE